jgi:hypothetical protein
LVVFRVIDVNDPLAIGKERWVTDDAGGVGQLDRSPPPTCCSYNSFLPERFET